jgi:hypothetical protein
MSVKFTYLLHWLGIRWTYVVATALAIFFVILKGFPILKEWFKFSVFKWNLKKLGLVAKLQVEPQLVTALESPPKKKPPFKRIDPQPLGPGKDALGNGWLVGIGIADVCVGFAVLIIWLFER